LALRQTNGSAEAAINWLTERQSSLVTEPPAFSPQSITVDILSNTIQLCHFGPLMRFLRRCISMLDHQNSSAATQPAAVVNAAQRYQEFAPDLQQWAIIQSSLTQSVRPGQLQGLHAHSAHAAPPPPPVQPPPPSLPPPERPKWKLVPINSQCTVLFNHELPVVAVAASDERQQQPVAGPRRPAFKLVSNANSGVSPLTWVDTSSSEVQAMELSPDDLQYAPPLPRCVFVTLCAGI